MASWALLHQYHLAWSQLCHIPQCFNTLLMSPKSAMDSWNILWCIEMEQRWCIGHTNKKCQGKLDGPKVHGLYSKPSSFLMGDLANWLQMYWQETQVKYGIIKSYGQRGVLFLLELVILLVPCCFCKGRDVWKWSQIQQKRETWWRRIILDRANLLFWI